jgi:hypothetical protein
MNFSPRSIRDDRPPSLDRSIAYQPTHKLTVPIFGPNTPVVNVRYNPKSSHAMPQDLLPAAEGVPVRSTSPTGAPVLSDDTPAGTSRVASPEAAVATAETDGLQADFRNPLLVPGHKGGVYVYKHADSHISDVHRERFPDLVEIFRLRLLETKDLAKSSPASVEYKLKLCGRNPQEACPSILICHPFQSKKIGRSIYKNLTSKALRVHYEGRGDTTIPGFQIYLFFSKECLMLGDPIRPLSIYMNEGSFVGAPLFSNDHSHQVSTVTCGITFAGDNTIFALTSAHAFEDDELKQNDKPAWSYDDSTFELGSLESDDTSSHRSSDMDDEYDWDELEQAAAQERQEIGSNDSNKAASPETSVESYVRGREIQSRQVWGRPNNSERSTEPNLDWALVEMPSLGEAVEGSLVLSSGPSEETTSVVVVTHSGPCKGTLSSLPSYFASSRNFTALTKIWTLTINDEGTIPHPALVVWSLLIAHRAKAFTQR